MYAQRQEEEDKILNYFSGSIGRFLDIGAADGISLSNIRVLYEWGWKGVLIEPSKLWYEKLYNLYKDDKEIITINKAIASYTGKLTFYETENPIYTLGSSKTEHCKIWKNYGPFIETEVDCLAWSDFIKEYKSTYDFISIDCEGMDNEILHLMNLNELGNRMICIEWNYHKQEIQNYLLSFGYTIIHRGGENIIGIKE